MNWDGDYCLIQFASAADKMRVGGRVFLEVSKNVSEQNPEEELEEADSGAAEKPSTASVAPDNKTYGLGDWLSRQIKVSPADAEPMEVRVVGLPPSPAR